MTVSKIEWFIGNRILILVILFDVLISITLQTTLRDHSGTIETLVSALMFQATLATFVVYILTTIHAWKSYRQIWAAVIFVFWPASFIYSLFAYKPLQVPKTNRGRDEE